MKRGGGIVSLAPVVAGLDGIRRGTDRIAAELAIPRLEKEIGELEEEMKALVFQLWKSDLGREIVNMGKREEVVAIGRRVSGDDAMKGILAGVVGLSLDDLEQLSERYLNRRRPRPKQGEVVAFEDLIRLKKQVGSIQAELERHKRELASD